MVAGYGSLGHRRMQDLFQIKLDHRFLVFATSLPSIPNDKPRRVSVEGLPGVGWITVDRDAQGKVERLNLSITDYPRPKQTNQITVVFSGSGELLTLCQTVRADENSRQVFFQQRRGVSSASGDGVDLTVTESGPTQPLQLTFWADDFNSFIRDHPLESNLYLRSILRQLGVEVLLAPDPTRAWQVFSDLRKPDPIITAKVNELLPSLNSPDYHVRNETMAKLLAVGRETADVIDHMDRKSLTPEQNIRLDRIRLQYEPVPHEQIVKMRMDPAFLLDCLYSDDAAVRQTAMDRLRTLFRPDLEFHLNAPLDVRAAEVAKLRQQLTPGQ